MEAKLSSFNNPSESASMYLNIDLGNKKQKTVPVTASKNPKWNQ